MKNFLGQRRLVLLAFALCLSSIGLTVLNIEYTNKLKMSQNSGLVNKLLASMMCFQPEKFKEFSEKRKMQTVGWGVGIDNQKFLGVMVSDGFFYFTETTTDGEICILRSGQDWSLDPKIIGQAI